MKPDWLGAALPHLPGRRPTLEEPLPMPTAESVLRCIQRPTGEWFTFAAGNAPGKDTPDATELLTEAEAREGLRAAGIPSSEIDARLATARAKAEVSGDELPLPDPVVGGPASSDK